MCRSRCSRYSPLTQQQTVSDATQAAEALDSFINQGDLRIATDLADTRLPVRINVISLG